MSDPQNNLKTLFQFYNSLETGINKYVKPFLVKHGKNIEWLEQNEFEFKIDNNFFEVVDDKFVFHPLEHLAYSKDHSIAFPNNKDNSIHYRNYDLTIKLYPKGGLDGALHASSYHSLKQQSKKTQYQKRLDFLVKDFNGIKEQLNKDLENDASNFKLEISRTVPLETNIKEFPKFVYNGPYVRGPEMEGNFDIGIQKSKETSAKEMYGYLLSIVNKIEKVSKPLH